MTLSRLAHTATSAFRYVRCFSAHGSMGGLHAHPRTSFNGRLPVVYHPSYSAPRLGPRHRFPMAVFERIYDRLLNHHRLIEPGQVYVPDMVPTDQVLSLVHDKQYLEAFSSGQLDEARTRRIGFGAVTASSSLIERTKMEVAGTLLTARLALEHGIACNTAGGTHHAFPSEGSGYCILNDLAVTAEVLINEGKVRRVLILDLDVHQGDGTAACFSGRRDVFTLSVHCESNFPSRKQNSTLDVGLADGVEDKAYLSTVAEVLSSTLASFRPDVVLFDAGVDVHANDALGRLKAAVFEPTAPIAQISDEGLTRRELLVLDTCLGGGIPVAGYVGGGYDDDLNTLADRHINLHWAASRMWNEHRL